MREDRFEGAVPSTARSSGAQRDAGDPPAASAAVPLSTPIVRSTTFATATTADHARLLRDRQPTFYQRFGAPNERRLEALLAALDGGENAAVFASGMAAISTSLLTLVPPRGHVVAARAIFEQTARVLDWMASACGVDVSWVDARDSRQVAAALRPGGTALLYVETPSNPLLHVVDVPALAALADSARARLLVDATFASPALSQPLAHGAHLVVHSLTKLINGHSDAMGGAVVGDATTIAAIQRRRELLGGVLDPQTCWLIERGLATLPLRAARVSDTALRLAATLERQPAVAAVRYPLLPSHEGYAVAQRQMQAGGPVVAFRLHGGVTAARELVSNLRLIRLATSLGGIHTVIELPYDLDWVADATPDTDRGWLRLSAGLEPPESIEADLVSGLARLETV